MPFPGRRLASAVALSGALTLSGCGGDATGIGINLVPGEQVQAMGADAWRQIRSETPPSNNAQYQAIAQRVSAQLLRAAGKEPAEWEVVVFQGDEPNAFALPGGKIGVYEGMMRVAGGDDRLAAVIAHEIAHNDADHAAQRVNSEMATQIGIDLASAVLGGGGAQAQQIATILGAGAQYGVILPYSRNQELEADRLGLQYMARAGYDPQAAVSIWETLQAEGGARPPTFLSTHPAPEERIAQLQAQLPEAMDIYRQSQ